MYIGLVLKHCLLGLLNTYAYENDARKGKRTLERSFLISCGSPTPKRQFLRGKKRPAIGSRLTIY